METATRIFGAVFFECDNIGIYSVYVIPKGQTDPVFADDPDGAYNIPGVHIASK